MINNCCNVSNVCSLRKLQAAFFAAMLCINAAYAITRCLSVCHGHLFCLNEYIYISNFFHHQVFLVPKFFCTKCYGSILMETP